MVKTTRKQRKAIKRLFDRSPDGSSNYLAFRRRVKGPFYYNDPVIMIQWCNMWIGIETDGYTHS